MNLLKCLKNKIYICMAAILLLMLCMTGCETIKKNKELVTENTTIERNNESSEIPESQTSSLIEVMYSIADSQGLEEALDYESGMQDGLKDAIVFLCKSESGKYEAYGFISDEYGKNGILINNVIDGQDNWNFFEERWSYMDSLSTLEEKGDYEVLFTFTQGNNGKDVKRSIYFDTYDTGTMGIRE